MHEVELENAVLKDPRSRSFRLHQLGLSATLASSGYGTGTRCYGAISLLPSISLIGENELKLTPQKMGSGQFGTCFTQLYSHFQVCVKIFKHQDPKILSNEANILSKFSSEHLPYLFGVCISKHAIITTFHGIGDSSVTLHHALQGNLRDLDCDWTHLFLQVAEGMNELHSRHKVLHNDFKSDNNYSSHNHRHHQ